ncbi:MAG: alternative ribosome rescue aminoacyl-tRNA hydrolase ArfB [Rubrivivax sp.]|jgi:ribosome-associated protein|nr:aminoacyl-tRNA hydrolase [Rubrivivax sp.]
MSAAPPPPDAQALTDEVEFSALRAQGPGGQNVNKVSNAVQLRFDVHGSSLPDDVKQRLLARADQRMNKDGCLVIKAQTARSLEQNKADALARLVAVVAEVWTPPVQRRATRPTYGSRQRRLAGKAIRSDVKASRGKVRE